MASIKSIISKKAARSSKKATAETTATLSPAVQAPSTAEVFAVDVSVVMPVYNCEDYIEQAIRSIAEHTDCRFEIIAVNDQSPDGALEILRELEKEFPQLKVFDQTNIGGAPTLNRGISYACGKYIGFLDSDDWMEPHALDILLDRAESSSAEVAVGVIKKHLEGEIFEVYDMAYIKAAEVINTQSGFNPAILIDSFYTGKLFLRQHLTDNNIWFPPSLLYADRPFVTKAFLTSTKIALTPNTTGYWRKSIDGQSITDGFSNPRNLLDKMLGFASLFKSTYGRNDAAIKEQLFAEASKRLFWNYTDALQPGYAPDFARALCMLLAAYPQYKTDSSLSLSLKRQRIFEQAVSYRPEHMHPFLLDLEDAITRCEGKPVGVLAKALRAVPHIGRKSDQLQDAPTLENFAGQEEDLFVFESFFGKSYGGNPRYVFEELVRSGRKFRAVWVYSPTRKPFNFKQFAKKDITIVQVARGSAAYKDYLSRAKYWVNNIRFSDDVQKPESTIYLQTWHGTPLKRLGLDIKVEGAEADARASFLKEAGNWDYLLAQNQYSCDIFKRAFDLSCPVLVEGYPANDFLVDPKRRKKVANYVRKTYDVPADKKVITYAPTWRETNRVGTKWTFKNRIQLDFFRLKERFSDDYVVLTRLHHLMANTLRLDGLGNFTRDASKEPDANRLMAATDVLITDFSSIFFDYACSGKPMIFHMYDIENYKNNLRGLYLDPYTDLPGPITTNESELITALENIDNWQDEYGDRFDSFRERFLNWDDGGAAKRVVSRVFSTDNHKVDLPAKTQSRFEKPKTRIFDQIPSNVDFDMDLTLLVPLVTDRKDIAKDLGPLQEALGDQVQILLVTQASTVLSKKTTNWIAKSGCDLYTTSSDSSDMPLFTQAMSDVRGEHVLVHSLDDDIDCNALTLLQERARLSMADVAVSRLLDKSGVPHPATSYALRATNIVTASRHNNNDVFADTHGAGKLFRKDFLATIGLQPISQGESNERYFVTKALAHAKCVTISPSAVVRLAKKDTRATKATRLKQLRQQTHTISSILLNDQITSQSVSLALASQLVQGLLVELRAADKTPDIERLGTIARVFLFSYPDYAALDNLQDDDIALLDVIRHQKLCQLEGVLQDQKNPQPPADPPQGDAVKSYQIAFDATYGTLDLQTQLPDGTLAFDTNEGDQSPAVEDKTLDGIKRFDRSFDPDVFLFMPQSRYVAQSELMGLFNGLRDQLAPFTAVFVKPDHMDDFQPEGHAGSCVVVERRSMAYYFWLSRSKYLFTDGLIGETLKGWETDADGVNRVVVQIGCRPLSKGTFRVGKSAVTAEALADEAQFWTYVVSDSDAHIPHLPKTCQTISSGQYLHALLADKSALNAAATKFTNQIAIKSHQRVVGMALQPHLSDADVQTPLIDAYYLADKLQYNFVFAVHDQAQRDWRPLANELRRFLTPDGEHIGLHSLMAGADILVTNADDLADTFRSLGRPVISLTDDFPTTFASSAQKKAYQKAGLVWDEIELAQALRTLDVAPQMTSSDTNVVAKEQIDTINEQLVQALFGNRPRSQNRLKNND